MNCTHNSFRSDVKVIRLADKNNPKVVTDYRAEVTISCAECEAKFGFIGLPSGYNPAEPSVSIDLSVLRLPIMQISENVKIH